MRAVSMIVLKLAFVLGLMSQSSPVKAGVIAYDLTLGRTGTANFGAPRFVLTNNAMSSFDITSFNVTVGDTAFNWDSAFNIIDSGTGFTLISPDTDSTGGLRDDNLSFLFTDFQPGEVFEFSGDLDPDSFNFVEDLRTVMFNNGVGTPNSVVTVGFSNSLSLSFTFPDIVFGETYSFSQSQITVSQSQIASPVPEPGSLVISLVSVIAVVTSHRRRRRT
jgi:hypothetical protein